MVARSFSHDFKTALDEYYPGKDAERVVLRAILESARQELLGLQTDGVNQAFDDSFITEADGDRLDGWGEVYALPRNSGESDGDYRTRLLTKKRARGYTKTIKVLKDTVDALGATFDPVLSVSEILEKYPHAWRWKDGIPWCTPAECKCWVKMRDLWVIWIVLSRAPTAAEAKQLTEALWDVKAVQQIVRLVTDSVTYYTLHREVYSNG